MPRMTANLADAHGGDCYTCDPEVPMRAVGEFPPGNPICFYHLGRELKQSKDPQRRAQIRRLFLSASGR
jgi:hypothetical protein